MNISSVPDLRYTVRDNIVEFSFPSMTEVDSINEVTYGEILKTKCCGVKFRKWFAGFLIVTALFIGGILSYTAYKHIYADKYWELFEDDQESNDKMGSVTGVTLKNYCILFFFACLLNNYFRKFSVICFIILLKYDSFWITCKLCNKW